MQYEYDDYEEDCRLKHYPPEMFKALEPLTRHVPKEEQELAARRLIHYLEIVIEQVDEEMEREDAEGLI